MSGEVVGWAMKQVTGSPAAKLVLAKLADNANEQGLCWPSIELIVEHTELGQSTVYKHLAALETLGLIKQIDVTVGGAPVRGYQLSVPNAFTEIPRGGKHKNGIPAGGKKIPRREKIIPAGGTHIEEPSLEPSLNRQSIPADAGDGETVSDENRKEDLLANVTLIWPEFVRCPGFKPEAMTQVAFKAALKAVAAPVPTVPAMVAAIRAYAGWLSGENDRRKRTGADAHLMKSPAAWLAQRSWERDDLKPAERPERLTGVEETLGHEITERVRKALGSDGNVTSFFTGADYAEEPIQAFIFESPLRRDMVARKFERALRAEFGTDLQFLDKEGRRAA